MNEYFIMATDQSCKQKHIKNKTEIKTKQDKIPLVVALSVDNKSLILQP